MKFANLMPSVSLTSFADDFSMMWGQAEAMAQGYLNDGRKGQTTKASMKTFVVGVVLIFLTLILVANFAPEAHSQINETNLSSVPGGDFLNDTGILLVMLLVTVAIIIAVLDLI